ncbi:transmembrane protein [Ceratobasidium sp. AG-Ba]|nr:transmembrane protein [Ceratobasidium sp. AG-Ba]
MNPRPPKTRVSYDLPATIKSIQAGWLATFQSAAIISALLVVTESVLLAFFRNLSPSKLNPESAGGTALAVFTYLGWFFGTSATFSSLLLTDEFGEIHVRASQRESMLEPLDNMVIHEDVSSLLKRYGARRITKPVIWHWFAMLVFSFFCLIGQLLVYIWVTERRPVAIGMSFVAGFVLLPILSLVPSK